jgi:alkaline phosphatase D
MAVLKEKYAKLKSLPAYAALCQSSKVIGTWDDHDYGLNDAGKEYPERAASQQCFLDFLDVASDSPRRKREGVYAAHTFGSGKHSVKILLLDTRYHRDKPGPNGDILGAEQWAWLKRELTQSTAQVHLLVSSIQVLASDHRFEKWSNFPASEKRLYELLARKDVPPVTILSGDRHLAEISLETKTLSYPLLDITSSSLNANSGGSRKEVNQHRLGENFRGTNFGTIEIDWTTTPATLQFAVRDEKGNAVRVITMQQGLPLP